MLLWYHGVHSLSALETYSIIRRAPCLSGKFDSQGQETLTDRSILPRL
jgi:hypothetical protein